MIKTSIRFVTTGRVIPNVDVNDYIFSALRGPDCDMEAYSKTLGASIIRKYLADYQYGLKYTLWETMKWCLRMNNTQVDRLAEEMKEIPIHYASHVKDAYEHLYPLLMGRAEDVREQTEAQFIRTLFSFWDNVCRYHPSDLDSWYEPNDLGEKVKFAYHNLILFFVWNYPETAHVVMLSRRD